MEELSEFLSRTSVANSTTLSSDDAQTTSQTTAKPSGINEDKDVSLPYILKRHNECFIVLCSPSRI